MQVPEEKYKFGVNYHQNTSPLGFAENVNQAFDLRGKDADFFCIINPDIEIPAPIFPKLIKRMEELSIDVISPLVIDKAGGIQDSFRSIPTPLIILKRRLFPSTPEIDPQDLPDTIYPDWIAGLFMFMRSSVFEKTGGFSEKYRLYFEDVDFCLRARSKGYTIAVLKEVSIIHDARRQSRKSLRYLLYHVNSALNFFFSKTYRKYRRPSSPYK